MKYLKRTKLPRTTGINCNKCGIGMKCIQEKVQNCQRYSLGKDSLANGEEIWQCPKCGRKTTLIYYLTTITTEDD